MSTRRNRANNRITGPRSALTDFLSSHNIVASQIQQDYLARQQANQHASETGNDDGGNNNTEQEHDEHRSDDDDDDGRGITSAQQHKRVRNEGRTADQARKSKTPKKRKVGQKEKSGTDEDQLRKRNRRKQQQHYQPPPGQFANCETCDTRFTVTYFTCEGSNGGLLCKTHSKETKDGARQVSSHKKKSLPTNRGARRQTMSKLLDGVVGDGARSLLETCLEKVADVSNDVSDFGALPDTLLDRLSMIFSKKRVMTTRTLHLFLRPDRDRIVVYDAAGLQTSDFSQIFAIVPRLKHLKLTYAGQLKDETISYLIDRKVQLETLQLEAPNLTSDEMWQKFFITSGHNLRNFKIDSMDNSFSDETVSVMVEHCPNLVRLKLRDCWKLSEIAIHAVSRLRNLQHLSLKFTNDVSAETLENLVISVGPKLRTLSLECFRFAGDELLALVHQHCVHLQKLRFSHNDYATDEAYRNLFASWHNSPIAHADLSYCRDVDAQNPDGPEDSVGFASGGIRSLMEHSGSNLETLKINSCRHIRKADLLDVFDGKAQYPRLREINFSFIPTVDDVVVAGVFKSCPNLKKLVVFACFGIRDVIIPRGVALIGTPNAQDAIVQGDVLLI